MTYDELNKLIRSGAVPRILFFFGEEEFLLDNRVEAIKKKLAPGELARFNCSYFDGKADPDEIIAAAEMLPQGGDRRLVVVKNSGLFANLTTSGFKSIKSYAAELPDYVCLIFREPGFDPKKLKSLKFIEDAGGGVVNFERMPVNKLEVWVEKTLEKAGKRIPAKDLSYFVRSSGPSMGKLDNECRKLILYMGENRHNVTRADIDAVVDKSAEVKIYDIFSGSIIGGSGGKAMEQLKSLKNENVRPTVVLSVILDGVYELLLCKLLKQDGLTAREMSEYFDRHVPMFAINKAVENSRRYGEGELKRFVDRGLKYSVDIKTGRLDGWDAVELYVSELLLKK